MKETRKFTITFSANLKKSKNQREIDENRCGKYVINGVDAENLGKTTLSEEAKSFLKVYLHQRAIIRELRAPEVFCDLSGITTPFPGYKSNIKLEIEEARYVYLTIELSQKKAYRFYLQNKNKQTKLVTFEYSTTCQFEQDTYENTVINKGYLRTIIFNITADPQDMDDVMSTIYAGIQRHLQKQKGVTDTNDESLKPFGIIKSDLAKPSSVKKANKYGFKIFKPVDKSPLPKQLGRPPIPVKSS